MQGKQKVVILGGGVGAIWAAYQLSSFTGWEQRFDITLYQMGWRLGGKCASGRNAQCGQRIEEHGLHIWSGFYDNAIKIMKQCYAEAQPLGGVFPSFDAAFKPFNNIVLAEQVDGKWIPWHLQPPGNAAVPGEGGMLLSPWDYVCMALEGLQSLFDGDAQNRPPLRSLRRADLPQWLRAEFGGLNPASRVAASALHHLAQLARALPKDPRRHRPAAHRGLLFLLEGAVAELHAAHAICAAGGDAARRLFNLLDLGLACVKGMVLDKVILKGFDVIDDYEISAWLGRHGAHPQSLDSACARGIYDYAFGFSSGQADAAHRAIAAGTSVRGMCRLMFTYKGSYFFKMQGGMGDTVFTPFYKVLRQRGVKFRFFHKVTALQADAAGGRISRILMQRQADLKQAEYDPLVRVADLDCWPSQADFAQLEQGEELRQRGIDLESAWADWSGTGDLQLECGKDFDQVILGIPAGALPQICSDLVLKNKDASWQAMLERLKTTRTLACQLWLKKDTKALGWPLGETILTSYAENFDTWADMSQLLPREQWPAGHEPRSVAYFCGPMADDPQQPPYSDRGYPQTQYLAVREQAREWMQSNVRWLWPAMQKPGGAINWNLLQSAGAASGAALFDQQYFRANIDPAERYVLSVPGSTRFRLRSDRSGFDNLFLAGDWTYNGINAGCVEAAAMSGMRAAAGLAGERLEIVGETDNILPPEDLNRPLQLISQDAPNLPWPGNLLHGLLQTAGANALLAFPRQRVQDMLPRGLELDTQDLTSAEQHPVVMFFGWQSRVRPNFSPIGMNYREFIISVPYVRHADPALRSKVPGPFIYMPQLYLDRIAPVRLGVYVYGYKKALAQIAADGNNYVVRQLKTGDPIIAGSFRAAGATGAAYDFPNLCAVQRAYALPLISKTLFGTWLYSYFDFALGQALIQPIEMSIEIHNDQAAGLPPGPYRVPSISDHSLGGFFLSTAASISNPLQSHALGRRIGQLAQDTRPRLLPFG